MKIQGKKIILSQLLLSSGLHRAVRAFNPKSLTIFNFHRIRDVGGAGFATEFDEDVFGPTAEQFRTHLRWLKTNAEILSESDFLSIIRSERPVPARSAMITFDDGYLDNFTLALPVLKELGVPASFFIPTQAIEERSLGWWDLIAYIVKKSERPEIHIHGETVDLSRDRSQVKIRFQRWMKLKSAAESQTLVQDLARACGVELPSREICGKELMNWDQVRATAEAGISIGSHTHSHRVLATLSLDEQREELRRSKAELQKQIGRPVRTLAYPVGGYEHFNTETKAVAQECGYEAAFSFHTGVNTWAVLDRFDVRRISAPEAVSLYCGSLALPRIYAHRRCEASETSSAS